MSLTMGPASGRRTLLDRVALFWNRESYRVQQLYSHAMRSRQSLLQTGGASAAGIDAYEQLMADHGVTLTIHREQASIRLLASVQEVFENLAPRELHLKSWYARGGSLQAEEAKRKWFEARKADAKRSSASFGPHRDDLIFELNGKSVRTDASQGQHRILTLSIKLAEMACIQGAFGAKPILLLDDVSSELDACRTDAFFELLGVRKDQVFLTTTRPEMLPVYERRMGEAKIFRIVAGTVVESDP